MAMLKAHKVVVPRVTRVDRCMAFAQKDIIFKIHFAHSVTHLAVYLVHHLDVQKDIKPHPGSPRVPRDIPRASTADVQKDTEVQLMARVPKGSSFPNKVAARTNLTDQLTPFVRTYGLIIVKKCLEINCSKLIE